MTQHPGSKARLAGLTAVVTGSSSGIGRAIARLFAAEGASIVCADVRKSPREGGYEDDIEVDTDDAILASGGAAVFTEANASVDADIQRVVGTAFDYFESLDVMVNNAGIWTGPRTILDETVDDFDLTMAVNCKGVWLGCKYAIARMVTQASGGRIINVASMAGLVGLEREPAYCASKGAVIALTRQLALDYAPHHIAVNAICPGFVATALARQVMGASPEHSLTPWPRLGTPDDIARSALFLASRDSDWITGTALVVDGGYSAR